MKTEDADSTRFCKSCGTELFFLDRFPKKDTNKKEPVKPKQNSSGNSLNISRWIPFLKKQDT
ncbi:MAG: hypothetical protein LBD23_02670 [Oscillospiraceae bacterium]|jgi:hypothetical protein|nr:hypothetical protein [Oscillospiraceae bacterium]